MMTYYTVIISGAHIFFEDYNRTEPVVGFIACRLIPAQTEELAIATAKRDILVDWNRSFNADRKLGMPALQPEHIAPYKGWIKPKTKHDYYWFGNAEQKKIHVDKFSKPSEKWFWEK